MALPPLPPSTKPVDAPIATDDGDGPKGSDPELAPLDRKEFERATAAAKAGRLYEAKRGLGHLAMAYPDQDRIVDAYNAVVSRIAEKQSAAKSAMEQRPIKTMAMPPSGYALARPLKAPARPAPKLVKMAESKNKVTDDEEWFRKNGQSLELFVPPAHDVLFAPRVGASAGVTGSLRGFVYTEFAVSARYSETPLPLDVPLMYGTLPLTRAIDSKPFIVAIYGGRVASVLEAATGNVRAIFDFAAWAHPAASKKGALVVGSASLTTPSGTTTSPITMATESISYELMFALAADGLLYVEHTNLGYAKESKGLNAYVAAVDLDSGDLVWHSAPLVANGRDFAVVRGAVVCGYGFTAEPDFVFVLDGQTGAVRQKIPVSSGPDHFVLKDDTLRVRTYDTDYVFDVR